jgi:hypothetical protein
VWSRGVITRGVVERSYYQRAHSLVTVCVEFFTEGLEVRGFKCSTWQVYIPLVSMVTLLTARTLLPFKDVT